MSTPISCPYCPNRMTVPDRLAGKTVRCTQCGKAIPVRAVAEDDDRPAPRRSGKRAAKAGGGRVVVLAVGATLLLGVAAGAAYWFGFRKPPAGEQTQNPPAPTTPTPGPAPTPPVTPPPARPELPTGPPTGWQEYVAADDDFKAHFPGAPTVGQPVVLDPYQMRDSQTVKMTARTYSTKTAGEYPALTCRVTVFRFGRPVPRLEMDAAVVARQRQLFPSSEAGMSTSDTGPVTLAGRPAKQMFGQHLFPVATRGKATSDGTPYPEKLVSSYRWVTEGDRAYLLQIRARDRVAAEEAGFFGSFSLRTPPPGVPPAAKSPDGWTTYSHPGGKFAALMPSGVAAAEVPFPLPTKNGVRLLGTVVRHRAADPGRDLVCEVYLAGYGPTVASDADRTNALTSVAVTHTATTPTAFRVGPFEDIRWNGRPAREYLYIPYSRGFARYTITDTLGLVAVVYGGRSDPDPEAVRAFFDSVRFSP